MLLDDLLSQGLGHLRGSLDGRESSFELAVEGMLETARRRCVGRDRGTEPGGDGSGSTYRKLAGGPGGGQCQSSSLSMRGGR